ncbi:unnamed protein product [Prorocentrum cordatum]|nr:unnamed protein product [Polarella glacialis]
MVKQYEEAFQQAGGQEKAEPHFERVNRLCWQLREARPSERGRQDCGFEILGMGELYNSTAMSQPKLLREVRRIAARSGGTALCPDLKGRDRARAKALTKYGNDTACLTDLMRASIVYPDIDSLYDAFITILEDDLQSYRHDWHLVEVTDRFQKVRDGYRDISMLFRADGIVGEVQLHVDKIVNAKKGGGHAHYKKQRLVNELMFEACVLNEEVQVMKLASEFQSCASTVCDKNGRTADGWGLLPFELTIVGAHFETMELQAARRKAKNPVLALLTDAGKEHNLESSDASWRKVGKLLMRVIREHHAQEQLDTWFMSNVAAGNIPKVLATLEADFDMKVKPGQPSAMDRAIEAGHVELARLLGRRNPLMAFAAAGDLSMCKRLIECKAQLGGYDGHKCSVLDYARALGHTHVEEYFGELGSFPDLPFRKEGSEQPDLGMYVYGAVQDGCCGAISRVSRALARAEEGFFKQGTIGEVLDCCYGPFQFPLLQLAVQAVGSLRGASREDGPDPAAQVCGALLLARADPTRQNGRGESSLYAAAALGDERLHNVLLRALPEGIAEILADDSTETLKRAMLRQDLAEHMRNKPPTNLLLVKATFESFRIAGRLARMETWFQEAHQTWAELVTEAQKSASWRGWLKDRKKLDDEDAIVIPRGGRRRGSKRPNGGAARATRSNGFDVAKPTCPRLQAPSGPRLQTPSGPRLQAPTPSGPTLQPPMQRRTVLA